MKMSPAIYEWSLINTPFPQIAQLWVDCITEPQHAHAVHPGSCTGIYSRGLKWRSGMGVGVCVGVGGVGSVSSELGRLRQAAPWDCGRELDAKLLFVSACWTGWGAIKISMHQRLPSTASRTRSRSTLLFCSRCRRWQKPTVTREFMMVKKCFGLFFFLVYSVLN